MARTGILGHKTRRLLSDYGMIFVLLALCVFFSAATFRRLVATGRAAGVEVAGEVVDAGGADARVIVAANDSPGGRLFVATAAETLRDAGADNVVEVVGDPVELNAAVKGALDAGERIDAIAVNVKAAKWQLIEILPQKHPPLANVRIVSPQHRYWTRFLTGENLRAIGQRIVVIAVIAIGMTMVIITAGIDLSVGSLIAFSAVVTSFSIRQYAGGESASALGVFGCMLIGIAACAALGLFTGSMTAFFAIPPFVVTLAMMRMAKGLAFMTCGGQSISEMPAESVTWLGRGSTLGGIPNAVVLMVLLYIAAHVLMSRTVLGRYIYAVGGNREAARLSGVPVRRVLVFVYMICGAMAGLGGVIRVSQLNSGAATYGLTDELNVITAVVIGGATLSGGEGKVFGTLIGVLIIAVIENGMTMLQVRPYPQMVVLGAVLLGAVLIDQLKRNEGLKRLLRQRFKRAERHREAKG